MLNANAPFGGTKQSDFGRDMGSESLDEWMTVKAANHLLYSIIRNCGFGVMNMNEKLGSEKSTIT